MAEETTASNAEGGDSIPPEIAGGEAAVEVAAPENGNGNGSAPAPANQDPDSAAGGDESQPQQQPAAAAAPANDNANENDESAARAAAIPDDAPPDQAAGGLPGPNGPVPIPAPALANELAAYFSSLQTALLRQSSSGGNSATGIGTSVMSLLHDGIAPITAAGNARGGSNNVFLTFENAASSSSGSGTAAGDGGISRGAAAMNPGQAGLYLYAVAQNIVALEAAVLGSRPAASGGAAGLMAGNINNMDSGGGGMTAKQVADIISAVSIAATFCNSRSIITQSGILPALSHLIESTGTVSLPPSTYLKKSNKSQTPLHALTPFHPEYLQCSLLAGHYRHAKSFLDSRPTSHMTVDFPYLRIDPTSYLRTHYYAGLVHVGCDDWNAALDSFHLCLTLPCSSVSAISVAARKKQLLVSCLLLESEELDGNNNRSGTKAGVENPARGGGGGSGGKPTKSALENKVLDLPGAASAAVNKYMAASSNRVVSGGAATAGSGSGGSEREAAGSETSEQPTGRASRRRMRSNNPEAAGGSGEGSTEESNNRTASNANSRNQSHLGSYHDLISTYISGNASHYAKLLIEMKDLLHGDGNWGLAKKLEGRLVAYRAIRKVASVYEVVGLGVLEKKMMMEGGDINGSGTSGEIGRRGLEDLLMGMASCDARDAALLIDPFVAKIDQSTGMVSFADDCDESSDDDDDSTEKRMEADLSHRLQSCISLAERVRDLDVALTTSPRYQQHVMKEMLMKGGSGDSRGTMRQGGGSSVADIGHSPMDIGDSWNR